jgi:hypothetical protein
MFRVFCHYHILDGTNPICPAITWVVALHYNYWNSTVAAIPKGLTIKRIKRITIHYGAWIDSLNTTYVLSDDTEFVCNNGPQGEFTSIRKYCRYVQSSGSISEQPYLHATQAGRLHNMIWHLMRLCWLLEGCLASSR